METTYSTPQVASIYAQWTPEHLLMGEGVYFYARQAYVAKTITVLPNVTSDVGQGSLRNVYGSSLSRGSGSRKQRR